MNEKLITALLAILLALGGWTLQRTFSLSQDMVLIKTKVEMIEDEISDFKNSKGKKKRKKKQRSKMNKLFLVLALLFALSACSVGKKCTYTQDGTKISSWIWFYGSDKPIDLDKNNCG